jgi:hypothetical protein
MFTLPIHCCWAHLLAKTANLALQVGEQFGQGADRS